MSHRPRSRGSRHAGGGGPGPAQSRSAAPGRPRLPGRAEGRRKESNSLASRPVCTYPWRGKVPAQRGASVRAPGGLRSCPGRARGAGRGRKGERDGKRSRAVAQPPLSLGRAAAEPHGRREGRADFGNGDRRSWRGSGTTAAAARGHNPGGGRRLGAGRGGAGPGHRPSRP